MLVELRTLRRTHLFVLILLRSQALHIESALQNELASIVGAGVLTPSLDPAKYILNQIDEAHAKLESEAAVGEVVVTV